MSGEIKTQKFVCPNCGGNLKWNIQKQEFECESCRTPGNVDLSGVPIEQHPIEDYDEAEKAGVSFPEESFAVCQNCGAQVTFSGTQTSTVCPMCGSPQIDAAKQVAGVPPDGLIPFKVDKADAQNAFKGWVKSRWFAPNALKESYQQGKLTGVYLPFWTYDTHSEAHYRGQGGNFVEETDDEGRVETHTEWFPVSGHVQEDFDDIAICDSSPQAKAVAAGVLPYSTEAESRPYVSAYLSGMDAEHYTDGAEACFDRAEEIIRSELTARAEEDIRMKGYDTGTVDSLDMRHYDVEYKHLLLPAWLSAFAYKGKQYTYMINGETGKVSGERPYSIPKIIAAIVAGLILAFLLYRVFGGSSKNTSYVLPDNPTTAIVYQMDESQYAAGVSGNGAIQTAYWEAAA